ncbi:MAG TPA: hypothetical protein PKE39_01490 [Ignavibacteria bacterium]|nr:hypothetical protein [Ignavibacteria bacterium]HMQ97671.1 hypothetical protein [Ignavibacteria bacterium]
MFKNKSYDVIRSFSPAELKSFELFITSPYYNSNKAIIKLFELIRKYIVNPPKKTLLEEEVFGKIYPGKKYNYGIMKNLLSELFGLCEKFLAVHPIEGDTTAEFEESLKRLKNYNKHSLEKLFLSEYKKLTDKMEYSVLSTEYYRNKNRLLETLHKHYTIKSKYSGASVTLYPMSIFSTCDIIATIKKDIAGMEYLQNQLNYNPEINVTEAFYRNFDFENFLKEIKGLEAEHYNYISLQVRLMKLYKEPANYENYRELKDFIFSRIDNYSNSEKWFLSSALFDFVLNNYVKSSSEENLRELAHIRKTQLTNVKFNTDGLAPLQAGVFRNIIEIFVIMGDLEFALEVIDKHLNDIEESKRKSSYAYSMALIEEGRGNNEKVLEYIRDVEFSDYQAKFSVKMVALVAFYNLGYVEQGLSAIDSMKHFMKDTGEFTEQVKVHLASRVAALEKLFKIKANPEKYSLKDIAELERSANMYLSARKNWFLGKTAELRKLVK